MPRYASRLAFLIACAGASGALALPPEVWETPSPVEVEAMMVEVDPGMPPAGDRGGTDARRPGAKRGVGSCPDIVGDVFNCHPAVLNLGANFSGTRAGAYRVMDNVTPASTNPTRVCWIGRYTDRVGPAVEDESFLIRIFADAGGFPDLSAPLFERTFRQTGTAGVDLLEMDCLDGDECPGSTPTSGGNYVYSAEVATGLPMNANGCYWIEIACVGSSEAGLNWGWCASTGGTDLACLQAIDGAYTLFTRATNDRAICLSGGVNPALGNCIIADLPPVCTNPDTNGIPYDGAHNTGGRASWPGSDGRGFWTPFQRADSFTFDVPTTVTNVCFRGFWVGVTSSGGSGTPVIPDNPEFRVAYFAHDPNNADPADGVAPIAEFAIGDPGVSFVWDGRDVSSFTHPPVEFEAGRCYWISIGRIQSTPLPGEPTAPIWVWRLTTGPGVPTADGRTASRDISTATPGNWTVTYFRSAAPECATTYSNYVFLLNGGPTHAAACQPLQCSLTIPPDAAPNAEPNCALAGNLNGGCNLATPVFTPLACGETHIGSGSTLVTATCGGTRDTDWYHLTLTEETEVTFTVTSQFAGIAGFGGLVPGVVNPTGDCSEFSGGITPYVEIGSCQPVTLTRTLQPGTWIFFVASIFGDPIQCDNSNNLYLLSVECSGGPGADCNGNGIDDSAEIAGNAALDCFNPTVLATPHTTGGPDGALDECQCQANWNRDASVNSNDISSFLTSWLDAVSGGTASADLNCDGATNSNDISAFLTVWLSAVQNTAPHNGCP